MWRPFFSSRAQSTPLTVLIWHSQISPMWLGVGTLSLSSNQSQLSFSISCLPWFWSISASASPRILHQFALHNQWPRSLSKWKSRSKWKILIPNEGATATFVFSPCVDSIPTFKSTRSRVEGGAQLITPMCAYFESFASPSKNAISLLLQTLASKCTEKVFKHYSHEEQWRIFT